MTADTKMCILTILFTIEYGVVKVSTGVLQLEKLSAGDASNHKLNTNANNELAYAA